MRRITALVVALAVLSACGSDQDNGNQGSWSPYRPKIIATRIGADSESDGFVDLVERQPSDGFFYVVSRNGFIERWNRDGNTREVMLDVSSLTTTDNERGLLGLAMRRNRDDSWTAFVNRTNPSGDTTIDAYDMSDDGRFIETSRRTVMTIAQPYANHNGGSMVVAPDNTLLIGLGDGGAGSDPERRALDTTSLLGKILRINPTADGYDIPSDNPYANSTDSRPEIWSIGLRNPWRFTVDANGDLWIADVGQDRWEELSVSRRDESGIGGRGTNFGWSAFEGSHVMNSDQTATNATMPVFEYKHGDSGCSISGAAITTEANLPGWDNMVLFSDYCGGWVKGIDKSTNHAAFAETLIEDIGHITAVRATHDAVYVLTMSEGLFRLDTAK